MKIREATSMDLEAILKVMDLAKEFMNQTGNSTQWVNGYPSREVLLNDLDLKHGFVCEYESKIVGYFCFIKGNNPEPTYSLLENGTWLNHLPYGVVHRLASDGTIKGVAKACFDYCFSQIENIRVDTHRNNQPMQNFLKNYGFKRCGTIYVSDGSPRDAFQMQIEK